MVPSKRKMPGTEFDVILNRIKSLVGAETIVQLGEKLGCSDASIRSAKTRNKIPDKWLTKLNMEYHVPAEWILTGKMPPGSGEQLQASLKSPKVSHAAR